MPTKEEIMSRSPRGLAAAAVLSTLAFAACGGAERATVPPTTTQPKPVSTTTAEPEPEAITAAEQRWLEQIEGYSRRIDGQIALGGAITQSRMRREARLYLECAQTLRRAGEPGRFEPTGRFLARACEHLADAGRLLREAAESSGPGGFVFAGTAEAKAFSRAISKAFEAAGNGQNDLHRALADAEEIERSFGT
jgi:hypothetical protein